MPQDQPAALFDPDRLAGALLADLERMSTAQAPTEPTFPTLGAAVDGLLSSLTAATDDDRTRIRLWLAQEIDDGRQVVDRELAWIDGGVEPDLQAWKAPDRFVLAGAVVNQRGGGGLPGVVVRLTAGEGGKPARTVTGPDGRYLFALGAGELQDLFGEGRAPEGKVRVEVLADPVEARGESEDRPVAQTGPTVDVAAGLATAAAAIRVNAARHLRDSLEDATEVAARLTARKVELTGRRAEVEIEELAIGSRLKANALGDSGATPPTRSTPRRWLDVLMSGRKTEEPPTDTRWTHTVATRGLSLFRVPSRVGGDPDAELPADRRVRVVDELEIGGKAFALIRSDRGETGLVERAKLQAIPERR